MDDETQPQAQQGAEDAAVRKQHEAFQQFIHECMECQHEIEPHWQVCAHCGTRLATSCPGCGTPLPPAGALACPHCGLAIPQGQP